MYKTIILTWCVLLGVVGSTLAAEINPAATIIQPTAVVSEEYVYNTAASTIDNSRMTPAVNGGDLLTTAAAALHDYAGIYDGFFISSAWGYPSDFFADLPANSGGDTDVDIVYDLGSDTTVAGIVIWQYGNNGGGASSVANHVRTIEIRVNTEAEGSAAFAGAATTVTLLPVTDGDEDPSNDLGGVNAAQIFALDAAATGRYVQISMTDNYYGVQGMTAGGDRVGFSEVRFTDVVPLINLTASNPDPENGEGDVEVNLSARDAAGKLSWTAPDAYAGATYDVYFGTTEPNDLQADYGLTQIGTAGQADTSAAPALPLENSTPYWWVVDSREPNATAPLGYNLHRGSHWTFTTIAAEPIITTEPVSKTAVSAELVVEALNPEVYEWYQVGNPTPVQTTGTLGTPAAASDTFTTGTEGYYYCVVSNTAGSDTSNTVRVMTPRLVAHWKLDGDLTDASAEGIWDGDYVDPNTAAANPDDSTVNYIIGADGVGQAVQFNGYNVVQIPDSNEFFDFHGQGLTLTAWILGPPTGDWKRPVQKGTYAMVGYSNGSIAGIIEGGPGWQTVVPAAEGTEGEWRFVAMTYDPEAETTTYYSVYDDDDVIDVLHTAAQAQANVLASDPRHFLIGGASATDAEPQYNFDGAVDDVRVYNYPLMQAEIVDVWAEMTDVPLCLTLANPEIDPFDYNRDCQVTMADFAVFASKWLNSEVVNP